MSSNTNRDKFLTAGLPALIIMLLGWLFFLRPSARETESMRQRVQNLEKQGTIEARKNLVARAASEHAALEKLVAAKGISRAVGSSAFDRNSAVQLVSQLCAAFALSLNKSEPEQAAKLPPALQEAITALAGVGTPPQVWRVELGGSYPDVVKLLDGLQKSNALIIPLSISMQSARNERLPATWVLNLWL